MLEINKLYYEDCLEGMKKIDDKSIDFILCDLPYGTTKCKWDVIIPFDKLWEQYNRIVKCGGPICLTSCQPFTSELILSNINLFKYELIWHKTRNSHPFFAKIRPLPQHENVVLFGNGKLNYYPQKIKSEKPFKVNKNTSGKTDGEKEGKKWAGVSVDSNERFPNSVFQISNPSLECGFHPTQKPIGLCEYLLKTYSLENDLVLDNCAGSGSTLVAAKKLNRRFLGFENNLDYYKIACERIGQTI